MNEKMKSVKKVKNGKLLKALLVLAIVVGLSIAIPVAAAPETPETATIPPEAKNMVSSIVGLLQWMLYLVGGGLILFGGFTALMGWYQERPDDAARGFRTLAVGGGIFALGFMIQTFFSSI